MLLPLPLTIKLEVGTAAVVKPLTTAPGLTQLEAVPVVNAKLVNVALLATAALVRVE